MLSKINIKRFKRLFRIYFTHRIFILSRREALKTLRGRSPRPPPWTEKDKNRAPPAPLGSCSKPLYLYCKKLVYTTCKLSCPKVDKGGFCSKSCKQKENLIIWETIRETDYNYALPCGKRKINMPNTLFPPLAHLFPPTALASPLPRGWRGFFS